MAPKLQEDWMGTQGISISLCLLSLFAGIPLLGAAGRILVTAPELQEDWMGTQSDQPESMLIKFICRYSSTGAARIESWSRHQNCKRIRWVHRVSA